MTTAARPLYQRVSSKVWNATIKIPELKTPNPAIASSFDHEEVILRLLDLFEQYKGRILVITGAGKEVKRNK